jgi:hypothetical protein
MALVWGVPSPPHGLTLMLAMIFVYPMFNNKHINFGFIADVSKLPRKKNEGDKER